MTAKKLIDGLVDFLIVKALVGQGKREINLEEVKKQLGYQSLRSLKIFVVCSSLLAFCFLAYLLHIIHR